MESEQAGKYEVIITDPAEISFYEILDYLYEHYEIDRAEEVADEIRDSTKRLKYMAEKGTPEPRLSHKNEDYRFILYERTSRAEVKIIYYIEEGSKIVYITDFFPTEKDDTKISERNG